MEPFVLPDVRKAWKKWFHHLGRASDTSSANSNSPGICVAVLLCLIREHSVLPSYMHGLSKSIRLRFKT